MQRNQWNERRKKINNAIRRPNVNEQTNKQTKERGERTGNKTASPRRTNQFRQNGKNAIPVRPVRRYNRSKSYAMLSKKYKQSVPAPEPVASLRALGRKQAGGDNSNVLRRVKQQGTSVGTGHPSRSAHRLPLTLPPAHSRAELRNNRRKYCTPRTVQQVEYNR